MEFLSSCIGRTSFCFSSSYGVWVKEFPRFPGTFKQTEGCEINPDRTFWVVLFGICSIMLLNSLSREAHRLIFKLLCIILFKYFIMNNNYLIILFIIFILRADRENKRRHSFFFFSLLFMCVRSEKKGLIQNGTEYPQNISGTGNCIWKNKFKLFCEERERSLRSYINIPYLKCFCPVSMCLGRGCLLSHW